MQGNESFSLTDLAGVYLNVKCDEPSLPRSVSSDAIVASADDW
jgi:hypothetical protein